ncbi:MAG: ROK family protein [Clostridia bacterium]|nr:ROK family protein [Clostridia bacterium]
MLRIGVDIGGTYIKAGLVQEKDGTIIHQSVVNFPKGENVSAVWDAIYNQVLSLLKMGKYTLSDVPFIGVAVPGSVNKSGDTVIDAYNLNFHNVPIKKALISMFGGLDVKIVNDANAATLAEHKFGVLKDAKTAVLLTLGTGIGGGLIIGGKLFNGGNGNGVEIGHMTLKYDGDRHSCGNFGCFETYCSAGALIKDTEWSNAYDLVEAVKKGNGTATKRFEEYLHALSSAIVSLTNILDPEIIALGGGISESKELLLEPLRKSVHMKSFHKQNYRIECASMGNSAGFVGAAMLENI